MNAPSDTHAAILDLLDDLDKGGSLPVLPTRWHLGPGEVAHVEIQAACWWYGGQAVPYQQGFLAFGGPILFAATALGSVVGNYMRRAEAARQAAPQWRPLGAGTVLLTNQRSLLVLVGESISIWHDDVLATDLDAGRRSLTVQPENDVPYGLTGPDMGYLAVVLVHLLEQPDVTFAYMPHPND